LIHLKDLSLFQKFVRLCAGRTGMLLNMNQIANETGISVKTVQSWISVLEASYIIFLLQPWFANINKRLVKTPIITTDVSPGWWFARHFLVKGATGVVESSGMAQDGTLNFEILFDNEDCKEKHTFYFQEDFLKKEVIRNGRKQNKDKVRMAGR